MTLFTSRCFSVEIISRANGTYLARFLEKKVVYWMPGLNEVKNSADPQLAERLVSNYVAPGTRLRLCGDICQQVKERDWIFNKVEDNLIFLIHETGAYGIVVGIEDIDWTEF